MKIKYKHKIKLKISKMMILKVKMSRNLKQNIKKYNDLLLLINIKLILLIKLFEEI